MEYSHLMLDQQLNQSHLISLKVRETEILIYHILHSPFISPPLADGSLSYINESLFGMTCGLGSPLTVPRSTSNRTISCAATIRDDSTALENDEISRLRAVPNVTGNVNPVNDVFTAVVEDDDGNIVVIGGAPNVISMFFAVPGISVTPTTTSVVEGDSVVVCVMSNTTSARLITVTLSTMNRTATSK